ncbi:hypothetical protein [Brevundimonas sp. GCM10030266]|uniref:hypothetical protein n=1 Tax=Brevundimonas sp. GCM10030266 TaxID=3273386 RepID=UPI00360FBC73
MAKFQFDHHTDRKDAAAALVSLREVGMKSEDVGSLWQAPPDADALWPPAEKPADLYEATLADIGAVQLSGWIAHKALNALSASTSPGLADVLDGTDLDSGDRDRIRGTLLAGGGVIGVKARDILSDDIVA